jgi:hypothetical protein
MHFPGHFRGTAEALQHIAAAEKSRVLPRAMEEFHSRVPVS